VTDLTDRLRTCAAYILGRAKAEDPWAVEFVSHDTADLLIEASNALEAIPAPLGEPMEIIPPVAVKPAVLPDMAQSSWPPIDRTPKAMWTTNAADLPPVPSGPPSVRPNRVCPKCDSRTNKRVFRDGTKLFLACPVCAAAWEYKP
jgi:hypothetical protein